MRTKFTKKTKSNAVAYADVHGISSAAKHFKVSAQSIRNWSKERRVAQPRLKPEGITAISPHILNMDKLRTENLRLRNLLVDALLTQQSN